MDNKKIYLTQKGFEEYNKDIEKLKQRLHSNSKEKSDAYGAAIGDGWHDNFAFEDSKRVELTLVQELESKLKKMKNIVIIEKLSTDYDVVDIDDVVKLNLIFDDNDRDTGLYRISGNIYSHNEGGIQEITVNSPLGSAIYGRKVGESVIYNVSDSKVKVEILAKIDNTVPNSEVNL